MKSEYATTSHKLDILTDLPINIVDSDGVPTAVITVAFTEQLRFVPLTEIKSFVPIDKIGQE